MAQRIVSSGLLANLPASGAGGPPFYYATDDGPAGHLYVWDGSDWEPLTPDNQTTTGAFYPEVYGAVGDGSADDQVYVQAAITAAAGSGRVILSGTYRCDSQLLLPAGSDLYFASTSAALNKNYTTSSGFPSSFLCSGDGTGTTKANGITITGPGRIYATSTLMKGNIIGVYGDDFTFEDFKITCWAQGRAIVGAGDHWRGRKVRITGSDGLIASGGLRYEGGDSSVFSFLHVESGDDALQMVPSGNASDPLFDQSITRCTYIGCTGKSVSARFMVAALIDSAGPGGMNSSITDSGFIACRGYANTRAIMITNRDSTGDIDGITFQDCSVDTSSSTSIPLTCAITSGSAVVTGLDTSLLSVGMTVAGTGITGGTKILSVDSGSQVTLTLNATATNAAASLTFGGYGQTVLINRSSGSTAGVLYYSGVGAVQNISLNNLLVKTPVGTNSTIGTAGVGLKNLYLDDCTLPASPNATSAVMSLQSVTTVRIQDGQVNCLGKTIDGVSLGGASTPDADVEISGTKIIGIANSHYGINMGSTAGARLRGIRAEEYAGQTTAKAWRVAAASSGTSVVGNDWSQLSNATKYTDLASDTENADNLGDTSAYGGIYDTIGIAGALGGPPRFIRRTTDSSTITASTTLTSDDTLTIAVAASDVWTIEVFLIITGANTTHDIKVGLATPTSATGYWGALNNSDNNILGWGPPTTTQTPLGVNTTFGGIAAGTFAGLSYASFMGIVAVAGTPGNIVVQWAQNVSDAGALGLKAQSFMRCTRIA